MEVLFINNSNDSSVIKGRIDGSLSEALKQILLKKKMSQQDLIDMLIKDYVIENINIVLKKDDKGSK